MRLKCEKCSTNKINTIIIVIIESCMHHMLLTKIDNPLSSSINVISFRYRCFLRDLRFGTDLGYPQYNIEKKRSGDQDTNRLNSSNGNFPSHGASSFAVAADDECSCIPVIIHLSDVKSQNENNLYARCQYGLYFFLSR